MSRIVPASLAQMTDLIAEEETMDGFDLYTVLLNTPRPGLDANFFFPNFTKKKEDSPSHQNISTCIEYLI
jgi:hypothetical protein